MGEGGAATRLEQFANTAIMGKRRQNAMKDFLVRLGGALVRRASGLMKMRVIFQPITATLLAIRAGVHDARAGPPLYFWSIFTHRAHRRVILRDGWKNVGKVFLSAVVIDCIYQVIVFRWLYPAQALIVAVVLVILPYLIVRGVLNRIARRWHRGAATPDRDAREEC